MSYWTHVHGVIEVDTFGGTDAESVFIAQTAVDHLPRISGSEGDVEYYVNLVKGHDSRSDYDEFCMESNLGKGWRRRFESQSRVIISMHGDLRDRMFGYTLRETQKALSRLAYRLWIKNCLVSVQGDCLGDHFVFDNPDYLRNMWEYNSNNWVNRMRWDRKSFLNKDYEIPGLEEDSQCR